MQHSKIITIAGLVVALTVLSGCTVNLGFGGGSKGPDGGVFKTTTKGEAWDSKALVPTTSGRPGAINNFDASVMALDPSDSKALYYGTFENGLMYSYDGGDEWFPVISLGRVTISALAVDPADKCSIYAAIDNKVMKSEDCSRTWTQTYFDNELDVKVSSIAIDGYDSRNVYIGTSRGEIIASSDYGKSWRTLNRFEDKVKKVVVAPADSRVIFVATERRGLFRTMDKGTTWISLEEALNEFPDANRFRDLYASKGQPGFVLLATNYGLVKTINYGDDWTALTLITPEKEATINAAIVSEQNSQEIFYITNTTFYGSSDGGANWTTKKLPSARSGWNLLADPKDINTMYLGVRNINQ